MDGTAALAAASAADKAAVLVESLPYIRRFLDKVVVVKYGGNVLAAKPGGDAVDEDEALDDESRKVDDEMTPKPAH